MLVDDDRDLLVVAKRFLSVIAPAYEVIVVASAQEALCQLQKGWFDVIVADYQMPQMTGLELLQVLRQKNSSIPFILLTSFGLEEIAAAARELGREYYLKKEGSPDRLYGKLVHLIQSIIQRNHPQNGLALLKTRL